MALSFFFSLLVSLYLLNGVHTNDFEEKTFTFNLVNLQTKHKLLDCLLPEFREEKGAIILEMKDRRQCSSSGSEMNKHVKWNRKRAHKELAVDGVRVRAIQKRIWGESETEIPLTTGMKFQTLNYMVSLGLGGQNVSVIVDTGSDLTWVQCAPCNSCYTQQAPLFQPSNSPSYHALLCNSTACPAHKPSSSCSSSSCNYVVNYGDGSYSSGELGVDKVSFGGSLVSNIVFGCGRNNKGLFGVSSGLMGLAASPLSIVSQTNSIFGGIFSYCLPPEYSYSGSSASGSLIFGGGEGLFKNLTPISYTRMLPDPQLSNFYILNLTAISVGGVLLQPSSSSSVFGNNNNNNRILIDSGTVITRLRPSIYSALKAEFLKQFSGYPAAPPFSILDTCFNLSAYDQLKLPTITFYFDGAELKVDVTGIFYLIKQDASRVCLAIASLSDDYQTPILGNFQQRNQRVIYDTNHSTLGFAPEPCSFSFT